MREPTAVLLAGAAAVAVVALVDPNEAGHYPTCPFLAVTGHFCPGCGSLRAVHAMAHGDVGLALSLNVLTVAAVVTLGVVWLRWVVRLWAGRQRTWSAPAPVLWALVIGVTLFTLVRNTGAGSVLAP